MAESKSGKIVHNNTNTDAEMTTKDSSESTPADEVMEPMMLEDYNGTTLPLSLQNLLNFFKESGLSPDKNDITALFLYIMMLETGFVTSDYCNLQEITTYNVHSDFHYQRFLFLSKTLPKHWKNDSVYTFDFVLPPFVQDVCTVIGIVVSDDFVVNCTIRNMNDAKFCMLIDPSMYIVKSSNVNSTSMFQNLKALSIKFKTSVSNPCKCLILHTHSLRSPSLQGMPPEIILGILNYCDRNTFACLKKTCKYFRKICLLPKLF